MNLREDTHIIIKESIKAVLPGPAVKRALSDTVFSNNVAVISIGKAAWHMAKAASGILGDKIKQGLVITKYNHSRGAIQDFEIIEAGHPIPDGNSVLSAQKAIGLANSLSPETGIVLLISGGSSSLFEKPLEGVELKDIKSITNQLLACGANIVEINSVRKHLSAVKGGRFAQLCGNKKILAILLSDVIGNDPGTIASGPAYQDNSTSGLALDILKKYKIGISGQVAEAIKIETPKVIKNCETIISGDLNELCNAAAVCAQKLGYKTLVLPTPVECEAREAGELFAAIAHDIKTGQNKYNLTPPCAVIAGGETVVNITGPGKGGRSQETVLSAALGIEGMEDVVFFSVGSDGTDGPTDAAGGIADGHSTQRMRNNGVNPKEYLNSNDSYQALKSSNDLIFTGPTGTNVNDLIILLCG